MAEIKTHRHHGNYSVIGPVRLPLGLRDGNIVEFTHDGFRFPHGKYSALYVGDVQNSQDDILVRISSNCQWAFYFGSQLCDCRWQIEEAKRRIADEGRGMVIFAHDQHGKGVPIEDHWLIYAEGQRRGHELVVDSYTRLGLREDYRDYADIITILRHYNIKKIRLMTNSPARKEFFERQGIGVFIEGIEQHINPHLKREYSSKKKKLGHFLRVSDTDLE